MLEHGEGLEVIDPATAIAVEAWRSANAKNIS
jgi:glucose-6-phosphate isomerase